ncbi:phosphonate metabolism transcriptional regulator PhnF [Cypionkella psychrotolerans]|uniref:phosphonate metabolism transcriptional regulator PhnF n=1 Tax=Cypionkella psychrotolerans TaxID=1678131 RepID=UPI0006B62F0B|nr:phosphonate metabolism transcriptional regulator PhnF [Cypionkella psychrotolerans]
MTKPTIWRSIAETLTDEITAGHYRPGDKLPTEAALSARFGVNRHTVRHALTALAEAGSVHARRGAGVFVTATPTDYALSRRVRFHQNVLASGRTPSRHILRQETRPADPGEAAALHLLAGALVQVVDGLSLADGTPLAMFRSIFPAARFPNLLEAMTRHGSVTAALAEAGLTDYTRAETRITAIAADALLALHLRLAQGAPLLRSVAVNVDAAGQPIEFGTTWFAGDRVTLTVSPEGADAGETVDKLS